MQFVNARLLVDTRRNAVIVPTAAVQRGPDFYYVFVATGDPKAEQTVAVRKVTPGPSEGDQVVIDDGLSPGERVVTDGVDKLQDGSKVTTGDRTGGGRGGRGGRGAGAAGTAATQSTAGPTSRRSWSGAAGSDTEPTTRRSRN
jgi:multidrug efflux system membrane fusion protein